MDITKYKFETVSDIDMAFSTFGTDKILLKEAKDRGFYNGNSKYNDLFSTLFFQGGKLKFKKGLDEEFKSKALPYMRCFMGSFSPRHEEKEAICALLLSELVDV